MALYYYTRVSTLVQADGESLAAQFRQLEGWALMRAVTAQPIPFEERGVSGSIPLAERPQGALLLKMLKRGDTVVATKLDRMFRSALDALQVVEQLANRGVSIWLLDLGEITNGMSKLFLTISAAFAEAERARIQERVLLMKADQKARNRYMGGKLPFGFTRGADGALEPVPTEQVIITTAHSLRAEGKPLRTIQSLLIEQHGRKLSLDAISRIVSATA